MQSKRAVDARVAGDVGANTGGIHEGADDGLGQEQAVVVGGADGDDAHVGRDAHGADPVPGGSDAPSAPAAATMSVSTSHEGDDRSPPVAEADKPGAGAIVDAAK